MTEYDKLLKDKRWLARREEILKRDEYTCQLCSATHCKLNVHHIIYKSGYLPWDYEDNYLITLCYPCHDRVHGYRVKEAKLQVIGPKFKLPKKPHTNTLEEFIKFSSKIPRIG
jgi:5-methylcytosine-specific restriction endonuclease McrA